MSDTNALADHTCPAHLFPDGADMATWNVLSPAEQFALIDCAERDGFESGAAGPESLVQRLARVRGR